MSLVLLISKIIHWVLDWDRILQHRVLDTKNVLDEPEIIAKLMVIYELILADMVEQVEVT